jgi:UDP-glucose-4-epimerase GalE
MSGAVLVAGGAGYIGAHVCKALAEAGRLPVVLDDLSAGHADFVRWGPFCRASVADGAAVGGLIAQYGIRAAIDLAGRIEVGESVRDPLAFYGANLADKVPFLAALAAGGVRHVVLSSSAAVYGEPEGAAIAETHPLRPANPYGRSKLAYEQMLADCAAAGGPRVLALRYFNAAGADAAGGIGEAHEPETHLIARAALAALGLAEELAVFGRDWPTQDGTAVRDYVHVSDLAEAHVRAVAALEAGAPGGACNLGSGVGHSVAEVLAAFAAAGAPVPHRFAPRRAGDTARLVADISRARDWLGWTPRRSDIATIVASALAWHRARRG